MQRDQLFRNSIIRDMSEGVMAIRFDGVIELVNESALTILEKAKDELEGKSFAGAFFDGEENDAFIQCVLDAVYEKGIRRESYAPYRTARGTRQLRVVSSCLRKQEEMTGVILVISDITELTEMRNAVRAMETIQGLNRQLELRNRLLQKTFGRYLSDDVVREILASPKGWKLGGQRKTLTVLMSDLRGFTALSEAQIAAFLDRYLPIIDPQMVPIVINEKQEVVGAAVTIGSLSQALQKAHGRLWPTGWWHLIKALKWRHEDTVEMLLVGVRPDYQGLGVNALFFEDLIPVYNQLGFKWAETGPQLEDNVREMSQWKSLKPELVNRRRCYIKKI